MRTGVILPTFRTSADEALAVAARADELGIDGVFCYDHLWPMGQPDRPALAPFPVLAAVAATTSRVAVGTLVARIGLVPDEVLVSEFDALSAIAPGRVVAALGTGDHLSADENRAYGIAFSPPAERRDALRRCVRALRARGVTVWIGGGAPATTALAGEEGVAVNMWGVTPEQVAAQAALTEVTWAGLARQSDGSGGPGDLATHMDRLAAAGATWMVLGWPAPLEELAAAARDLPAGDD
jgi:alkanesulfonate monooxygenase SsuD/methylene tetrahydromethanopterin reductase-like flavin-dependent oxidoreductase (luciferase family)